jgi:hypothetical protein
MLSALLHKLLDPCIYFFFRQVSVVVRISFLDNLLDIFLCYFFWLSANFGGKSFLVNIEDHANEAVSLVSLEDATVIGIVLLPDLVDNVFNDQFVL